MPSPRLALTSALLILLTTLLFACSPAEPPPGESTGGDLSAPMAKIVPHQLEAHGDVRVDNYYWLRERDNPEVIAYLEAENAYKNASMKHTESLQQKLYDEMVGRIKKDDDSVPYLKNGYYYYSRVVAGGEYALYCRKKGSLSAAEEILLDGNELAVGHGFFSLRGLQVSPNQNILAYSVDTVGRRFYTIQFKDLTTGEPLTDVLPDVTGNVVWANDNKTIFYTKQDPQTLRSHRIYRHTLGTDPAGDELVYEEPDETFSSFVFKTRSNEYILIVSNQTLSTEYRYLKANDPTGTFQVFLPRERGHEYGIDHHQDHFYIRTNDQAKNFRLMKAKVGRGGKADWREVIPHREDVYLSGVNLFRDFMVVAERRGGLPRMRIMPFEGEGHELDFGEAAYIARPMDNYDFDTQVLRYGYGSMTTPWSVYDYEVGSRQKTLLKQEEVLGGFERNNYQIERLSVPARDGKEVPVSVVYRKGMRRDGSHPLLLYAYGSYGAAIDPSFSSPRLSLLDRGFVYVIAHIRGGQVLGRGWYEDGKLLKKKNTFTDFIDVGDFLVKEGYTGSDRLFAEGGSAGGLLMGAIFNMRPDLFKGVVAAVPFVDVITTMLDTEIPLTAGEFDEWGDPRIKEYYEYMLSYSPYDQVEAKDYTNLLVTTGLHDSQVQYWEPAKWVARLRALKTDSNRLLLHTNMEAGHGGSTGRFERLHRTALTYAFMLDLAGITE